jgi:hypothetical protein
MAGTIVDAKEASEPMPETVRDPIAPEPTPPPKSSRGRVVLAIVFFLLVLSVASALAFWFFFLRYRPTARAHVPAGTNAAIRLEAADVLLFGPVRNHLLPLALDDGPSVDTPTPSKGTSRAAKIHDRTGVHLPADVREIIVASMDGKSWVGLLGGRIEPGRFVAGLAEVAKEEGWAGFSKEGDVLVGPSIVIGQADDGTIIVGTDRSIVNAALPATDEGKKIGLPEQGAVTFALGKRAFEALAASPLLGSAAAWKSVERGTGSLTLGPSPELVLRLEPAKAEDAQALEEGTRAMITGLGLALLFSPDVAGEKEALRAASIARENSLVVVRAPFPYEGLDRAAAKLAAFVRAAR